MNQEIQIGKGLGEIHFGISKSELIKIVGEPNEKDLYNASDEEDGFLTETWHYDDNEFSVSFDEEDGWKLTTITTSNSEVSILGENLIGENQKKVLDFLNGKNLGDYEIDDLSDDSINQKVVSYIESSLNLWFIDNELSEIQWGVLWKDEDTPIWPS